PALSAYDHTTARPGMAPAERSVGIRGGVGAEAAVEVAVAPLASPELARSDHPFQSEAGLLQGLLLGRVLRMGTGLDAHRRRVVEQVVAEHRLRPPADALATPLGQQRDADLPVLRHTAVQPGDVADEAGPLAAHVDDESPVLRPEVPVGRVAPGRLLRVPKAGPVQADEPRLGQEPPGEAQVLPDNRRQADVGVRHVLAWSL